MHIGSGAGLPVIVWVLTAVALLLAIATIAASRGIVGANRWFGIRLPSLLRTEAAWRAGYGAAIPVAWIGFALLLGCAIIGRFVPEANLAALAVFAATVIAALLIARRAALATR